MPRAKPKPLTEAVNPLDLLSILDVWRKEVVAFNELNQRRAEQVSKLIGGEKWPRSSVGSVTAPGYASSVTDQVSSRITGSGSPVPVSRENTPEGVSSAAAREASTIK